MMIISHLAEMGIKQNIFPLFSVFSYFPSNSFLTNLMHIQNVQLAHIPFVYLNVDS